MRLNRDQKGTHDNVSKNHQAVENEQVVRGGPSLLHTRGEAACRLLRVNEDLLGEISEKMKNKWIIPVYKPLFAAETLLLRFNTRPLANWSVLTIKTVTK